MKVYNGTLGLVAAGAIALSSISPLANKADPPKSGHELLESAIVAYEAQASEDNSPPDVMMASHQAAADIVAKGEKCYICGKEVALTGQKPAAGVITFRAGIYHTATVAHPYPRVLAIPVVMVV